MGSRGDLHDDLDHPTGIDHLLGYIEEEVDGYANVPHQLFLSGVTTGPTQGTFHAEVVADFDVRRSRTGGLSVFPQGYVLESGLAKRKPHCD